MSFSLISLAFYPPLFLIRNKFTKITVLQFLIIILWHFQTFVYLIFTASHLCSHVSFCIFNIVVEFLDMLVNIFIKYGNFSLVLQIFSSTPWKMFCLLLWHSHYIYVSAPDGMPRIVKLFLYFSFMLFILFIFLDMIIFTDLSSVTLVSLM